MINFEEFLPLVSKNSSGDTNHTLRHLGHPELLNFVTNGAFGPLVVQDFFPAIVSHRLFLGC